MSFNHKTIEELHDLLVSKEISATELTQATLDDIKAREGAVNAFVTVAEEAALAQAKAIDEKMFSMNFRRLAFTPVPNLEDATIYRIIARYSAATDGENFYRR